MYKLTVNKSLGEIWALSSPCPFPAQESNHCPRKTRRMNQANSQSHPNLYQSPGNDQIWEGQLGTNRAASSGLVAGPFGDPCPWLGRVRGPGVQSAGPWARWRRPGTTGTPPTMLEVRTMGGGTRRGGRPRAGARAEGQGLHWPGSRALRGCRGDRRRCWGGPRRWSCRCP